MELRNRGNEYDLPFRRLAMMQRQNHVHVADAAYRQRMLGDNKEARYSGITVNGKSLSYSDGEGLTAVYIAGDELTRAKNCFEVEVIDLGFLGGITVGLVPYRYPLASRPGCSAESVGYHSNGKVYKSSAAGHPFGPIFGVGDKIGCRVNFDQILDDVPSMVPVTFTKNGKEVGRLIVAMPLEGFHPAVSMQSEGEEVQLELNPKSGGDLGDVILMSIDSCEEDWSRLHDIRVNGQMLEYVGRGKSITDVGLAQARHALSTRYHYFETQIVDPGENCYIAIGLARRDYPKHRHPGWNRGSIAYHADDGKIFVGSGVGEQFGPECNRGDTMGCGMLFPRDYSQDWDLVYEDGVEGPDCLGEAESESEDEEWWEKPNVENGTKVQVFFTRNGKTIGKREVRIPKGGFFPTVGMLSCEEKVRVDLRPLTG